MIIIETVHEGSILQRSRLPGAHVHALVLKEEEEEKGGITGSGRRIEPGGEEFHSDRKVSKVQRRAKSSSSGGFTISVFDLLLNTFFYVLYAVNLKNVDLTNIPADFRNQVCVYSAAGAGISRSGGLFSHRK